MSRGNYRYKSTKELKTLRAEHGTQSDVYERARDELNSRDQIRAVRRSWLAIIISVAALVVAILAAIFK